MLKIVCDNSGIELTNSSDCLNVFVNVGEVRIEPGVPLLEAKFHFVNWYSLGISAKIQNEIDRQKKELEEKIVAAVADQYSETWLNEAVQTITEDEANKFINILVSEGQEVS